MPAEPAGKPREGENKVEKEKKLKEMLASFPEKFSITATFNFIKILEAGGDIDDAVRIKMMRMKAKIQAKIEAILTRYKIFKYYGFDIGNERFEFDYDFNWVDFDGIIQLLRLDMLPLGMKTIEAELSWLDGELEEVWDKKEKAHRLEPKKEFQGTKKVMNNVLDN